MSSRLVAVNDDPLTNIRFNNAGSVVPEVDDRIFLVRLAPWNKFGHY